MIAFTVAPVAPHERLGDVSITAIANSRRLVCRG
jgi:hypothetical protein